MTRQNLPDWPPIHKSKRGNKFRRHCVWKIMMWLLRLGMMALFGVLVTPVSAADYNPASGTNAVDFVRYDWHDVARNRDVPVKIYFPKTGVGPFPVIIFSHGLGGSREGYAYLGEYWASHGYVSVHLQHIGSDTAVFKGAVLLDLKGAMEKAISNPQNTLNRTKDVSFAIDQLEKLNAANSPLQKKLDLDQIGMAGHSFGAETTLVASGGRLPGMSEKLSDPRIKAAIAMSPPFANEMELGDVHVPVFVMTGTLDEGFTKAADRRAAFDMISTPETCLVIFNGLDHMTFSGHVRLMERDKDKKFQPLICAATTAFWDAHLRGNAAAKNWLKHGGFAAFIGDQGAFESK
jgi:predicted dienelactone hydrolase